MKNVAFIPVRLSSKRLSCKAVLSIHGKSILEYLIDNLSKSKRLDAIVVATTNNSIDDVIENECSRLGIECLRGNDENVLDRIKPLIFDKSVSRLIRVTGDCPLVDPQLIDSQIEQSYLFNVDCLFYDHFKYTIGLGGEVYKRDSLEKLLENSNNLQYSEYLIYYFQNNPDIFSSRTWEGSSDYISEMHLTLDTEQDFLVFFNIYTTLFSKKISKPFNFLNYKDLLIENDSCLINTKTLLKYKSDDTLVKEIKKWTRIQNR